MATRIGLAQLDGSESQRVAIRIGLAQWDGGKWKRMAASAGWAPGADGLMQRVRQPQVPLSEFLEGCPDRNRRLIAKTRPSGDAELDVEAFNLVCSPTLIE